MKKILVLLGMLFLITGCGSDEILVSSPEEVKDNPIVTMTIKDYGDIKIELYPKEAFNTTANFVSLVKSGFYNGNMINRVQKDFVVQGGGAKDPGYTIKGEFSSNGVENNISHEKGVISMARTILPDSASGQFFIMLDDNQALDGAYAAFGKVIEGMDVIDEIASTTFKYASEESYKEMGFLADDEYITIEKATVDTKGQKFKLTKNQ